MEESNCFTLLRLILLSKPDLVTSQQPHNLDQIHHRLVTPPQSLDQIHNRLAELEQQHLPFRIDALEQRTKPI